MRAEGAKRALPHGGARHRLSPHFPALRSGKFAPGGPLIALRRLDDGERGRDDRTGRSGRLGTRFAGLPLRMSRRAAESTAMNPCAAIRSAAISSRPLRAATGSTLIRPAESESAAIASITFLRAR